MKNKEGKLNNVQAGVSLKSNKKSMSRSRTVVFALFVTFLLVGSYMGYATIIISENDGFKQDNSFMLSRAFDFYIYTDGTNYVAINNTNGLIAWNNTDFSMVINNCIQSVSKTKAISVHLGTGQFFLNTESINVSDRRVHLCGNGIGITRIYPTENFDKWIIRGNGTEDITWQMYQQFTINGRGTQQSGGGGFYFSDSNGGHIKDVHLDHVFVEETYSYGLYTNYAWGFCITNSVFERCHNDCGLYSDTNSNMRIIDCRFGGNAGEGMRIDGRFHRVIGCEFEGNDDEGLVLVGGENMIVANLFRANSATGGNQADLKIYGVSDKNIINSNIFDGNNVAKWGIELIGDYNIIDGNTFSGYTTSNFSVMDDGNVINGFSYNEGIPGSQGAWASETLEGVMVWDTGNSSLYIYGNNTWNQITLT